jgi:hypothetical protein
MASRTSWTAGNGVGFTWSTLINSADMASMATANTVLSSVADITNQTALDMFMDISYALAIASSSTVIGANFAFWLYALNQDGTHYGDNQFTAGTPAALTPAFPPVATVGIPVSATTTNMYGYAQQIIIPPGSFRVAVQNNSGFTLTSGTQTVKYRTYNLNLNN